MKSIIPHLLFIAFGLLTAGITTNAQQQYSFFAVSDLSRIYEDGYQLPAARDTIKIFGVRGEIISGQCAVTSARKDIENITVELKAPSNGRDILPAWWNFVGSIPMQANTPNQPLRVVERKAPANYPDFLMAEKQISVPAKMYKGIYITVTIPEDVKPGIYNGNITLKSPLGDQTLPVEVEVYPLTLPAERHIKVTEWFGTNFSKWHGIEEQYSPAWWDMYAKYARNMAEHRQNVFRLSMNSIAISKAKDGKLEFDFSVFDKLCEPFWATGKMDYLETGFLTNRGEKRWSSTEIFLNDFPNVKDLGSGTTVTIPGKEVIPQLLPAFENHLRQKGWLDKTYFHIMDEPSHHNAIPWMEISAYMHNLAPDLKRMDAIETFMLTDEIEVAVPKLDHFVSWYPEWEKARRNGVEVWFYTVGTIQSSLTMNKTIDMPVIESRSMHWLNYRYDAPGYLHWGYNVWTEDPYREVGTHRGDGWHVYPVKDGLLNSLRWEQMRNGIQDYECFWMLENRICQLKDSLGKRFEWIDPKQRSKEIASRVVTGLYDHVNDPQVMYDAKKQLLDELAGFNSSPMIYLQTSPSEYSIVSNQTRIGVIGWVEPGTKVVINRDENIPVSKQGMFSKVFVVTPKTSTLTVFATNPGGTKQFTRHFNVRE